MTKKKKTKNNRVATPGRMVTLHYKGTLEDGQQFDSSYDREEPMTVLVGSGQLINGFEQAVLGMSEGDKKTVTVPAQDAYGDVDPEAKVTLDRGIFPEDFELNEGITVPLTGPSGEPVLASVVGYTDEQVTVDLNHPMAGKELTFDIEVLEISEQQIVLPTPTQVFSQ